MFNHLFRRIGVELLCLWLRTLRVEFEEELPSNVIFGLWHQDLPACMAAFRNQGITVMISSSQDGEWAAMVARRLGYRVVRGSGRRGSESLRHLATALAHGESVGMALDGPKGPALHEKPGTLWLQGQTGRPVVRLRLEASRYIRVGSWDRTIIPFPFAVIRTHYTP